ncbi:hypothetical protein LPJ56_006832 [Coemansia sp. RSA 2599]|nr:hypothetical protein LPJ75_006903 [Coemansia sp. RSA 2598]KAJ1804011.1 hypothetical protein LPJ56_006832 [Coemansia sp. RSA 2599]
MDTSAQPAAPAFKEFSVKLQDNLSAEDKAEARKNIEKSVTDANGTFTWSDLIQGYIVKIPVASSPDKVAIASASALKLHLEQSVPSGIEYVDEEGMLKTQA